MTQVGIEQRITGDIPGTYSEMLVRSLAGVTDLYVVEAGPNPIVTSHMTSIGQALFHIEVESGQELDEFAFAKTTDWYKHGYGVDPQPPRILSYEELDTRLDRTRKAGV